MTDMTLSNQHVMSGRAWTNNYRRKKCLRKSFNLNRSLVDNFFYICVSGFGGLEVVYWPLVPKFAGSHPAEAVEFLGRKNPQHAFLRRGSKAVGLMS